jgi:hypothetical protein
MLLCLILANEPSKIIKRLIQETRSAEYITVVVVVPVVCTLIDGINILYYNQPLSSNHPTTMSSSSVLEITSYDLSIPPILRQMTNVL